MTAPRTRARPSPTPRRFRLAAAALLVAGTAALAAGCDSLSPFGSSRGGPPSEITELPRPLSAAEFQVMEASNGFGFDLLREIASAAPDSSHFIAPLSASMALGMTMNGARGATLEEMRHTLHFEGMTDDEINAAYRGLLDLLSGLDPSISFQLANSVWHRPEEPAAPDFVATVQRAFGADVRALDFHRSDAASVINGWVSEHTRGRIESIVPDPIPGSVVAYLLNAMYFQGDWTHRFDPAETREGLFHLPDGSTATARFMNREGGFRLSNTPEAQVAELPYGGQAYALTVVLPRPGVSLDELIASLDGDWWGRMVEGLGDVRSDTRLALPRFTLEWERVLNGTLEALGMPRAFTEAADFTRMFPGGGVFISKVIQKTFVQVDEEGTEAAAATSVEARRTSGPGTFRADRPFLFAIRERLSGTILFVGMVVEPPTG